MNRQYPQKTQGVHRRELLKAGLAAGATLSAWPLAHPAVLWGAEAGQPKRGGILRVWGNDRHCSRDPESCAPPTRPVQRLSGLVSAFGTRFSEHVQSNTTL